MINIKKVILEIYQDGTVKANTDKPITKKQLKLIESVVQELRREGMSDWGIELENLKDELIDQVDEYFPKIKPQGRNFGRGEAAVIVGTAMAGFCKIIKRERQKIRDETIKEILEYAEEYDDPHAIECFIRKDLKKQEVK